MEAKKQITICSTCGQVEPCKCAPITIHVSPSINPNITPDIIRAFAMIARLLLKH